MRPCRSVLLAVGDELLSGRTRDSNLYALGDLLNRHGLPLCEARVVPDDTGCISRAASELLLPGTLLVTTGGLGPTSDDVTLEGIATALGVSLSRSTRAEAMIEAWYARAGQPVPGGSMKQADLPEGGIPVSNPAGVAPGVLFSAGDSVLLSLPGVPREAVELLRECLKLMGIEETAQGMQFVRTWGIREIDLFSTVRPVQEALGVEPSYLPRPGRVDLGFSGPMAGEFRARVTDLLGTRIYSFERDVTLEQVLGAELEARGLSMAVAESCTGGVVSGGLTAVPGASAWFAGGVTAYSNTVKTDVLGVPSELVRTHGAVSREVALSMAFGVRAAMHARCSTAVTGVAGPSGGTPEKPVGTVWTAACFDTRSSCRQWRFGGGRDSIRAAAASCALGTLLELIRGEA